MASEREQSGDQSEPLVDLPAAAVTPDEQAIKGGFDPQPDPPARGAKFRNIMKLDDSLGG